MLEARTRRGALLGLAMIAVAGLGWRPGTAEAATGGARPEAFVSDFAGSVLAALRDPSLAPAQRLRAVDAVVIRGLDLDRIARIALGRHWKLAAEAERQEFAALFKAYVLTSYGRRFEAYADRRLRVATAAPAGEDVTVESYLEGGASPVRLDWRLARSGDGWRVLDVMVEGVSLLLTYRNEFAAVIEKGGGHVSALLGELRTRVAEQRAQIAS
jgi:phospholipid transport system substrate-binding protein